MSLWAELKRRTVFRVGAAYVVFGWLAWQVSGIVLGLIDGPEWVGKGIIALLLPGFVPVLALAALVKVRVAVAGALRNLRQRWQAAPTHQRGSSPMAAARNYCRWSGS